MPKKVEAYQLEGDFAFELMFGTVSFCFIREDAEDYNGPLQGKTGVEIWENAMIKETDDGAVEVGTGKLIDAIEIDKHKIERIIENIKS